MPLPSPILDDRSYAQLFEELRNRIPVYNPEWTDHNDSDPGITLLQLFAFQAENLLFRFNQIPEATYLEYLRLLQIPLRPAQAARTLASLQTAKRNGIPVPPKTLARAGKIPFSTLTEATVWPVSCLAAVRAMTDPPDLQKDAEAYEFALRTIDALPEALAGRPRIYYETKLLDPKAAEPSLDFSTAVDGAIWIALLAEDGFDKSEWTRSGMPAALFNIGFEPDLPAAALDDASPCSGIGTDLAAPQLVWQLSTGKPVKDGQPNYAMLQVVADSTRGLTQGGVVRLQLPRKDEEIGLPAGSDDIAGVGDFAPELPDEVATKLIAWIRVYRRDGSRFETFRGIFANAVEVEQARIAEPQFLGNGNGQPAQLFKLAQTPVLYDADHAAPIVEVEETQQWIRYQRVDDFLSSGRDSRHYQLDPESGLIRFGDGLRGRVPQFGERIRARGWRYGGGHEGNVPAGALNKIDLANLDIANPFPASGGADEESLEEALKRIPDELRRRGRAVTRDDFTELAAMTPGARIGRAECLPRFHPPTRSPQAAGVVSVVVWPESDPRHPNAPLPDTALLRAVCAWLDRHRLVTTELYVIPPSYRKIAVSLLLKVREGYGVEAVRRWVELVLRQYLAPLPPYGPEGRGWPLGRRVYGPELQAAALQVEGVEFIEELQVAGLDPAGQWVVGPVEMKAWEVPELASVIVVADPPLPQPGSDFMPAADGLPLPIPVLREVC